MMLVKKLEALQKLVESNEIATPKTLENQIDGLLRKALEPTFKALYTPNKEALNVAWLKGVGKELGLQATGALKNNLLKSMVVEAFTAGKLAGLEDRIRMLASKRKAAEALFDKELKSRSLSSIYSEAWLKEVCARLNVSVSAPQRKKVFVEALTQVFLEGKENRFIEEMKAVPKTLSPEPQGQPDKKPAKPREKVAKEPAPLDVKHLQAIYTDVCGLDLETTEARLKEHFPDSDDFELSFRAFVREFGIEQNRPRKRDLWLRKVAEELVQYHTGARHIG